MNNYSSKKYYETLGLKPDATKEEIKRAFRLAAMKFHPDINESGEKIFIKIKEAYEVLSNPEERKKYDFINGYDILKKNESFNGTVNQESENSRSKENAKQTECSDNQKINNEKNENEPLNSEKKEENTDFSNSFSDLIKDIFNAKNCKQKCRPIDGSDITMNINIPFKEAVSGTNRKINVLHTEVCPVCHGKTFVNGAKCKFCNGNGEISIHKKINVKIPPNTENNKKIRLKGEGTQGLEGGKNGNLYLVVKITDDSNFKFDGINVLSELEITPYEAALGTEKEVQTLSGKVKVKIPQGTSSGQKFSLAKEGLFDENKKSKGNQIITVKIRVNEKLSEQERKLYEELRKLAEK